MTLHQRRDPESRARLRERVKSEFSEMPGLSLNAEQAGRLLSLEGGVCSRVLEELVRDGFLRQGADGAYGRPDGGT